MKELQPTKGIGRLEEATLEQYTVKDSPSYKTVNRLVPCAPTGGTEIDPDKLVTPLNWNGSRA